MWKTFQQNVGLHFSDVGFLTKNAPKSAILIGFRAKYRNCVVFVLKVFHIFQGDFKQLSTLVHSLSTKNGKVYFAKIPL